MKITVMLQVQIQILNRSLTYYSVELLKNLTIVIVYQTHSSKESSKICHFTGGHDDVDDKDGELSVLAVKDTAAVEGLATQFLQRSATPFLFC